MEQRAMYENFKTVEDFEKTPMTVILSIYNSVTGKNIKGFHTRTKGIEQTLAALEAKRAAEPKVEAPKKVVPTKKTVKPQTVTESSEPKPKGKRGRKPINRPDSIIRLQTQNNHKRPDTWAHTQFSILMELDGHTVAEFLATEESHPAMTGRRAGWAREELAYAVRKGYVKLERHD